MFGKPRFEFLPHFSQDLYREYQGTLDDDDEDSTDEERMEEDENEDERRSKSKLDQVGEDSFF